jgi:hypothetical protein
MIQCGRFAVSVQLGGRQPLSSSATNIGVVNKFTVKGTVPTETAKDMSIEDIMVTIEDHVHAAKCAVKAGFDAIEIVRFSLPLFLRNPADGDEDSRKRLSLRPISELQRQS